MIAAAAGLSVPDERLDSFARGLARVRGFARELAELDLDGTLPWTPSI